MMMQIEVGQEILASGKRFEVEKFLDCGGQGDLYRVKRCQDGRAYVLKHFHDQNASTRRRIEYLASLSLSSQCRAILAPELAWVEGKAIGHITPYIDGGIPLKSFCQAGSGKTLDRLFVAAALTKAISVLSDLGMSHGDIQSDNVLVSLSDRDLYEAYIIDFDNYGHLDVPYPQFAGVLEYIAPEIARAQVGIGQALPDRRSDVFSLCVCLSYLILNVVPFSGVWKTPDARDQALVSPSKWPNDPFANIGQGLMRVHPEGLLDAIKAGLRFRPDARPGASEILGEIVDTLEDLEPHSGCSGFRPSSSHTCPDCKQSLVRVYLETGNTIELEVGKTVTIGMRDCGGNPNVSQKHLEIVERGGQFEGTPIGRNPTCILQVDGTWGDPLSPNEPVPLKVGQKWTLAGFQLRIDSVSDSMK